MASPFNFLAARHIYIFFFGWAFVRGKGVVLPHSGEAGRRKHPKHPAMPFVKPLVTLPRQAAFWSLNCTASRTEKKGSASTCCLAVLQLGS